MNAQLHRCDLRYEVAFQRPAFDHLASFAQIIGPIYDALSPELDIPPEALKVETGNSIDTALVALTLPSNLIEFQVRLDGYRATMLDRRSTDSIEQAQRQARLFETSVHQFLPNCKLQRARLVMSTWLTLHGGMSQLKGIINNLANLPSSSDPFAIGADHTRSIVKFECSNANANWIVGIMLDKSVLPDADLFLEVAGDYNCGPQFSSFGSMNNHLTSVQRSVLETLQLAME